MVTSDFEIAHYRLAVEMIGLRSGFAMIDVPELKGEVFETIPDWISRLHKPDAEHLVCAVLTECVPFP